MNTKSMARVEVKDAERGEVTCVFAKLGVVDHDGDVTLPGAFEDGAEVRISAYGHNSWMGELPVGKGKIRVVGDEALCDAQFFMDTSHGRDTFLVVKEMGPLQEWSYGYDPLEYSFGDQDGQQVRFLKKQLVHEVSPVLLGAGLGTRTVSAKSAGNRPRRVIAPHESETMARAWDAASMLKSLPADPRPSELRSVFAWVDPDGDPEDIKSYRFPHHQGVDGPANVRACLSGIAKLNSPTPGVPDDGRKAAYDHLAAHLRDAEREVPEFRATAGGADLKFADEGIAVLAAVSSFVDRASEVMALRAKKGKGLSTGSADLLAWIDDDLKRLKALLDNPQLAAEEPLSGDEISTLLAAVARVQDIQES